VKIVHIGVGSFPPIYSPLGGAIQRRIAELAQAQSSRGHEVTVFSPGHETKSVKIGDVHVQYIATRCRPPLVHLEYQARVVARLRRRRRYFDVVHFHSQPEGALVSRSLSGLKVLSYDNFYFRRGKRSGLYPLYQHALRAFDVLLPCSHYCSEQSSSYWAFSPARRRVLFNGVNLEQFRKDPAAGRHERELIQPAKRVILYLGRVCEQKGTDTLLEAFLAVRRADPDVDLVIAGPIAQFAQRDTSERNDWLKRMHGAGATYLDLVPDDRLVGLLNLADVFVMPTRELEMFGMAAVEAQACGTPVVASDHGGLRETVPAEAGLRFTPGVAPELADALVTLLRSADLRARLGVGALENARQYSWDKIALSLDHIYEDFIGLGPTQHQTRHGGRLNLAIGGGEGTGP
jgi:glycosyltransferase involved in cell wall biosynthesis